MSQQGTHPGIFEVTRGEVDLRVPPSRPPGRTWLYQITLPFQVAERQAAVFCNIREGEVKGVDFENGVDVVLFDDLASVSAEGAVSVTRNQEEPNPNSDPPGKPAVMVKYPIRGGFVPLGAKREDGSPHPHAGTGFGVNTANAWRTDDPGSPPYGVNMFGRGPSPPTEAYQYWEVHQFAYDGEAFRVVKTDRVSTTNLVPGWSMHDGGMTNSIPDGEEFLVGMTGGKPDAGPGAGMMRWRREGEDWRPVSFVPVTGEDHSCEPSVVRDVDGTLLFCARGGREPDDNDIRVWRSEDDGGTWTKAMHVRGVVSSAPISLNQAADGTPYVAANLYEVFLHPMGIVKVRRDSDGRAIGGGWTRKTLCIWPLDEDRTGLETPIVARDCRGEWGPPPGGSTWRIDHPSSMTVQLADGKWHNLLGIRVLEYGELTHMMGPTPQTGAYLEEVISAGQAIPVWGF